MPHSTDDHQNKPNIIIWIILGLLIAGSVFFVIKTNVLKFRNSVSTDQSSELIKTDNTQDLADNNNNKQPNKTETIPQLEEFPSLTKETIDKNVALRCAEGVEVTLWNQSNSEKEGADSRVKVTCDTQVRAYNQYYDKTTDSTWYAIKVINTDERIRGWVLEDLLDLVD